MEVFASRQLLLIAQQCASPRQHPTMFTQHPIRTLEGLSRQHLRRQPTIFEADVDMSYMLDQAQSPLFHTLPAEIRTRIFEYAVTPYESRWNPYAPNRYYYRPGYHSDPKQDVNLLRCCKRIFQEARLMPVAQAEHTFWLFRGPLHRLRPITDWQDSLNLEQRRAVGQVHIFIQQARLEDLGRTPTLSEFTFWTRQLTITIRHTDWWSWESPVRSSDRLGICPWLPLRVSHQAMLAQPVQVDVGTLQQIMIKGTWGWQIRQVVGLEVFRMEFETDVIKKSQLEDVLERAKHWKFPTMSGTHVLVSDEKVKTSTWEGPARLRDDSPLPLRHVETALPGLQDGQRTYYVAEMTWRRRPLLENF